MDSSVFEITEPFALFRRLRDRRTRRTLGPLLKLLLQYKEEVRQVMGTISRTISFGSALLHPILP